MIIWIESKIGAAVTVNFNPSVTLGEFKYIRLLHCTLYNSWFNITPANNVLRYKSLKQGVKTKTLKPGNYNIETLNEEIELPNNITFHKAKPRGNVRLQLSNDYEILFAYKRNFAALLGFIEEKISTSKESPNRANFISVSHYIIHCDAIDRAENYVAGGTSQWIEGKPADYLQILPLRETKEVCEKVIYDIENPINMPLKRAGGVLSSMKICITDQDGEPVNFNGYPYSLCIELLA